ncbi:MAG TPA: hypothetical protein VMW17_12375 [Candidatus Binatia bacterium]|nr:hypothetical protein [Candidatus Binatia bacterium]
MRLGGVQHTFLFLTTAIVLGIVVGESGRRLEHRPQPQASATEPIYLPHAKYLRAVSLGYRHVVADLLWFRTISYFGQHYRSERTYPWLAHMCDLVTDLDPRAAHVYRFAGVILPWEAGEVEAGNRLLEKGIQVFPDSGMLHYLLGFNYYFFTGDYARAAAHMQRAAQRPDAPRNAVRLAAVLAAEQYGPDTAVQFLTEMERTLDSQDMRDVVRRHLSEARLAADINRLTAAVEIFRARHGYLPLSPWMLAEAGLIPGVPADPFGGVYEIDPQTGEVRSSSGHRPLKLHQSPQREKVLRGESLRDW